MNKMNKLQKWLGIGTIVFVLVYLGAIVITVQSRIQDQERHHEENDPQDNPDNAVGCPLVLLHHAPFSSSVGFRSSLIPGPIDVLSVALLTYYPLAPLGLAFTTLSMRLDRLSSSLSLSKLTLPTGTWITAVLSIRKSTRPCRASCIARGRSWC